MLTEIRNFARQVKMKSVRHSGAHAPLGKNRDKIHSCFFRCRCPSGFGSPGPNPLADMDPQTKLSENSILGVLVEIDNTLRSSAY